MSTLLITGGCGFLGSHLARFLLKHDYNVILTDLITNTKLVKDIKNKCLIIKADVTNITQITKILKKHKVDAIVHFAALLSATAESDLSLGYKVDFGGTWNVYNAARSSETEKIIFASSIAAYGAGISEEAKENVHTTPQTLYGISKQFGEMLGQFFYRKYGIQYTAFRYASIIGPGRRNGGASAYSTLIVQKPVQGDPYEVNVRKKDVIPIAYIKDVTEVTKIAYENIKKLKNRIYNIASISPSPTVGELANTVKKQIPYAKIIFNPSHAMINIINSWPKQLDITTVQNELGWRPKYNTPNILIRDFIHEVKKHPKIFYV